MAKIKQEELTSEEKTFVQEIYSLVDKTIEEGINSSYEDGISEEDRDILRNKLINRLSELLTTGA